MKKGTWGASNFKSFLKRGEVMKDTKVFKARFRDGFGNAPVVEVVEYARRNGLGNRIHITTKYDPQQKQNVQFLLTDVTEIIERKSQCFS
jgi:hypothetical protein